jgi:hypothetical protein
MKLALLVFGQFRAWEDVLQNNLQEIKEQLTDCQLDLFILTDKAKGSMYSQEAERQILSSLTQVPNLTLKFLKFWEDLTDLHTIDALMFDIGKAYTNGRINLKNYWMVNLWYRRYILMKLVEQEVDWNSYDYFMFNRLFDTSIKFIRPILPLLQDPATKDTLLMCVDILFIASPPLMKKLLQFGATAVNWKEFEWTPEFIRLYESFDCVISKQRTVLCSESQIFHFIYTNFPKFRNIRYDFMATQSPSHADSFIDTRITRHMTIPRKILSFSVPITSEFPTHILENPTEFLQTYFPQYIPYQTPTLVAYLWLYIHGGFYLSSLQPLAPLRAIYEITELSDLLIGIDSAGNLSSDFIASTSGNPALLTLIEDTVKGEHPRILEGLQHFQMKNQIFAFLARPEGIFYGNQLILRKS